MAKALGKDIKEFYDNHFPEGYYHDDNEQEFHDDTTGDWLLEDATYYDLDMCGNLVPEGEDARDRECVTFSSQFNRWFKTRNAKTFVVIVPNSKIDLFRFAMKDLGIRV